MYPAISGVDASKNILAGHPNGGVAILFKKSLCNKINIIKTINRRISGIKIFFINKLCVYYCQYIYLVIIIQVVLVQSLRSTLIILSHCLTVWIAMLLFVVQILTLLLRDRMAKQNVLIASLR